MSFRHLSRLVVLLCGIAAFAGFAPRGFAAEPIDVDGHPLAITIRQVGA